MKAWLGFPIVAASGRFDGALLDRPRSDQSSRVRARFPHRSRLRETRALPCSCQVWAQADWAWSHGIVPDKQEWHNALKRAGMSGYDLWMKEACYLMAQNKYAPDHPSVSGGYTATKATPGTTLPPPDPDVKPWRPPIIPPEWEDEAPTQILTSHRREYSEDGETAPGVWYAAWEGVQGENWQEDEGRYYSRGWVHEEIPGERYWGYAENSRFTLRIDLTNLSHPIPMINYCVLRIQITFNYVGPWSGITTPRGDLPDQQQIGICEYANLLPDLGTIKDLLHDDIEAWAAPPYPGKEIVAGSFYNHSKPRCFYGHS